MPTKLAGTKYTLSDDFSVNRTMVFAGAVMPTWVTDANGNAVGLRGLDGDTVSVDGAFTTVIGTVADGTTSDTAVIQAALAVVVQRAARNVAAAERERLTAAVQTAVAARDALVAERAAEIVKLDAATASLSGLTGAARIPFVAARDAATAEIQRLAPLITTATAQVQAVQAERAVAGDATVAANVELVRLRAVADALR
jgi:hypothetical protein